MSLGWVPASRCAPAPASLPTPCDLGNRVLMMMAMSIGNTEAVELSHDVVQPKPKPGCWLDLWQVWPAAAALMHVLQLGAFSSNQLGSLSVGLAACRQTVAFAATYGFSPSPSVTLTCTSTLTTSLPFIYAHRQMSASRHVNLRMAARFAALAHATDCNASSFFYCTTVLGDTQVRHQGPMDPGMMGKDGQGQGEWGEGAISTLRPGTWPLCDSSVKV